jgi:isoamylase
MPHDVLPGRPAPLGATWDGHGVYFAVRSEGASRVELCLFAADEPARELARLVLPGRDGPVFHGYVAGLAPGALYGLRVHGPWAPEQGLRFNAHKLLVDPYARALSGRVTWNESTRGTGHAQSGAEPASAADLVLDTRDSGPFVPRAVVVDERFDWGDDRPPNTSWADTVIYELHVRGFSKQHPELPEAVRGSYAALAEPALLTYLRSLGVTAVELLPVHEPLDDSFLVDRGLSNYWGYSTLGFFAPAHRYASGAAPGAVLREFKTMVKALHAAGIEVILDVVYNHSCEGDHAGPTLCLKGVDNAGYYALLPEAQRYRDVTGCGNSLDAAKPATAELILASLRYWVEELHVDGFRFDLATTLGRDASGAYDAACALFSTIIHDPLLSRVKLIAEPWDLGPHGYRVGEFPAPMAEWNDKFRDVLRRLWAGADVRTSELADRLFGSPDVYAARSPFASINFVTAHDGFTLHDLVSYQQKYNLSNGEHNRDGSDNNESVNHGVEGETDDVGVRRARMQHKKNLLTSLFLSHGVPMLLAGDELGRTQRGNNNAYCQDNEISWLDWQLDDERRELLAFTRRLLALRRAHPELRRPAFLRGTHAVGPGALAWYHADGSALREEDWGKFLPAVFAFSLAPEEHAAATLFVVFNLGATPATFVLPGEGFELALSTAPATAAREAPGESLTVWTRRAAPGA